MLYGAFQKTVQTAIVLLIVSVASFGFLKLAPGDPVMAVMDEEFDQETYDRLFHEMGLDRAARARGEPGWKIVWVHAMRNVLMPVVTIIGLQLGGLLQGAVLTESVFTLPGLGQMIVSSVLNREYTVVQAGIMVTGVMFIAVNLIVDATYSYLDPRLRKS